MSGDPRFRIVTAKLASLHDRKQADYGRPGDPFANIRASADFGISPWVGAMVRANDKMRRLQAAAQGSAMQNESVLDSLLDIAVYAINAAILLSEDDEDVYGELFDNDPSPCPGDSLLAFLADDGSPKSYGPTILVPGLAEDAPYFDESVDVTLPSVGSRWTWDSDPDGRVWTVTESQPGNYNTGELDRIAVRRPTARGWTEVTYSDVNGFYDDHTPVETVSDIAAADWVASEGDPPWKFTLPTYHFCGKDCMDECDYTGRGRWADDNLATECADDETATADRRAAAWQRNHTIVEKPDWVSEITTEQT